MEANFELNSFEASKLLLTSLIFVVLVISLSTSIKTKDAQSKGGVILGAIMALAICYQYYLISMVSVNFPGTDVLRLDCLASRKGGKRPFGNTSHKYKNPCFNESAVTNFDGNSTTAEQTSMWRSRPSSICHSSKINNDKGLTIEPFISASRDCQKAKGKSCSLTEPCTPCEISRFNEFHNSQRGWSRCQACALSNRYGDCSFVDGSFVDGIGPFCWKDAVSLEVVPCQRCCSDGIAVFDDYGICH
jgi:hypothetical protein